MWHIPYSLLENVKPNKNIFFVRWVYLLGFAERKYLGEINLNIHKILSGEAEEL